MLQIAHGLYFRLIIPLLTFSGLLVIGFTSTTYGGPTGGAGAGAGAGAQDQLGPIPQQEAPAEVVSAHTYGYLQKYGYAPREVPQASNLRRIEDYHTAIRSFQHFFGLPQTGHMDAETSRLMSLPRCGVPDIVLNDEPGQVRYKRYALSGLKWEKHDLTYRFLNFSPDLSESKTLDVFELAFRVWSDVTPLTFRRVTSGEADIYIKFSTLDHGDGYPFDGEGGTLAHAFFPGEGEGGDAHFDDDETFTVHSNEGTDLFTVAAHEFGHSLGLGHSNDVSALMAPFYQGYQPNYRLSYDDRLAIQIIYGSNPNPPPDVTYQPLGPTGSVYDPDEERCSKSYTAIAYIRGEIFLFKGKNFWRMRVPGQPLEGYPIEVGNFWDGLPPKIDAVYERYDGKILFLKGPQYWIYEGVTLETGYPRRIQDLGLPDDIDGALPWGYTGKTYFFKGEEYWRYDEFEHRVDPGYPKPIRKNWIGAPTHIHAVFRHYDGYSWNTYFVRNRKYWRFDESRGQVDVGFPRIFGVDWMNCKEEVDTHVGELNGVMISPSTSSTTTDSGSAKTTSPFMNVTLLATLVSSLLVHIWR